MLIDSLTDKVNSFFFVLTDGYKVVICFHSPAPICQKWRYILACMLCGAIQYSRDSEFRPCNYAQLDRRLQQSCEFRQLPCCKHPHSGLLLFLLPLQYSQNRVFRYLFAIYSPPHLSHTLVTLSNPIFLRYADLQAFVQKWFWFLL